MSGSNFLNIQSVADKIITTKQLNISKAVSISYDASDLTCVLVKDSYSEIEIGHKLKVLKKGKNIKDLRSAMFEVSSSLQSLSDEKKKDLRAMIPYLANKEHKEYYLKRCG